MDSKTKIQTIQASTPNKPQEGSALTQRREQFDHTGKSDTIDTKRVDSNALKPSSPSNELYRRSAPLQEKPLLPSKNDLTDKPIFSRTEITAFQKLLKKPSNRVFTFVQENLNGYFRGSLVFNDKSSFAMEINLDGRLHTEGFEGMWEIQIFDQEGSVVSTSSLQGDIGKHLKVTESNQYKSIVYSPQSDFSKKILQFFILKDRPNTIIGNYYQVKNNTLEKTATFHLKRS